MELKFVPYLLVLQTFLYPGFTSNIGVDQAVLIAGNVTVAGLFEVENGQSGDCGHGEPDETSVMVMESVNWYFKKFNDAGLLPFKVGLEAYKTCGDTGIVGEHALTLVNEVLTYQRDRSDSSNLVVGVIGPKYSSESQAVSCVLSAPKSDNHLLQISPSATSQVLRDKKRFPNFYRVVPCDSLQVKVMIKLLKNLNWNRIAVIYENDTYGKDGAEGLIAQARAEHICVTQTHEISITESRTVDITQIGNILQEVLISAVPVIEGVVFFGSRSTASILLRKADNTKVSKLPVFLLTESMQLQKDVFRSTDGTFLSAVKDALVMSIPYTEVTSFSSYWRELFMDTTAMKIAAQSNPWLLDVFQSVTQCNLANNPACPGMTNEQFDVKFEVQPVYVKYSIVAAQAMAKSLMAVYKDLCPTEADLCENFKNNFVPRMLIDKIADMTVDFKTDFPDEVQVEPLTSAGTKVMFTSLGEIQFPEDKPSYEVYHFGKDSTNGEYLKIANYINDNLHVDEQNVTNIPKAHCPAGQTCTECLNDNVTEMVLHIPGEFYVIGIADVNNKAIPGPLGCGSVRSRHGYQVSLALKFGVDTVNNDPAYTTTRENFKNKRIGLIVLNSCNSGLEIARKILELHQHGLLLEDGSRLHLDGRVLGYVGGQATDVSQPAAEQLTQLGLVQISYASTNPVLSDKTRYPYFLRIVTPDNVQAVAMMKIIQDLDGQYVQLVYSAGAYGEGGRDAVMAAAEEAYICIAQTLMVEEEVSGNYDRYYELLRRKPHAKLVIIFLRSHVVADFMKTLNRVMEKGEFQFIGSEAWARNEDILEFEINLGSITVALEMVPNTNLDRFIQNTEPTNSEYNPMLENYFQARQKCYLPWSFDKSFDHACTDENSLVRDQNFQSDPWCIFATNSMLSFLDGASKFFQKSCGTSDRVCDDYRNRPHELFEEMKKVKFGLHETGSKEEVFDEAGNGQVGYNIYNIQADSSDVTKREYVNVGQYRVNGLLFLDVDRVKFPTDKVIKSECPNDLACADCLRPEGTTQRPKETSSDATLALGVVVGLLAVIAVILTVIIICLCRNRKKPDSTYITATASDERHVIGDSDPTRPESIETENRF